MQKRARRQYRHSGLDFSNLEFSGNTERKYVQENIERIAKKIRETRLAKNLSQEQLAEMSHVSVSTIRFIERSQRAPSLPMLFKLLFLLDRNAVVWE